jgi:hypothetical protein
MGEPAKVKGVDALLPSVFLSFVDLSGASLIFFYRIM